MLVWLVLKKVLVLLASQIWISEAYLGPSQISTMEFFCKNS